MSNLKETMMAGAVMAAAMGAEARNSRPNKTPFWKQHATAEQTNYRRRRKNRNKTARKSRRFNLRNS